MQPTYCFDIYNFMLYTCINIYAEVGTDILLQHLGMLSPHNQSILVPLTIRCRCPDLKSLQIIVITYLRMCIEDKSNYVKSV